MRSRGTEIGGGRRGAWLGGPNATAQPDASYALPGFPSLREVWLYSQACKGIGIKTNSIEEWLKDGWDFPASGRKTGKQAWRIFNEIRARSSQKADHLKASAAELLGLYGLFRHWAATVVGEDPRLALQRESLEAGCAVVDLILLAKNNLVSTTDASRNLLPAMDKYMRAHTDAYGEDSFRPKHHWMYDVAEQIADCAVVLDAFVIERLHLRTKRCAEHNCIPDMFEEWTLRAMVNAQVNGAFHAKDGLTGSQAEC